MILDHVKIGRPYWSLKCVSFLLQASLDIVAWEVDSKFGILHLKTWRLVDVRQLLKSMQKVIWKIFIVFSAPSANQVVLVQEILSNRST